MVTTPSTPRGMSRTFPSQCARSKPTTTGRYGFYLGLRLKATCGTDRSSVGTLLKISDALGSGCRRWSSHRHKALKVTRCDDGPVWWSGEAGGRRALVSGTEPSDVIERWDWTLRSGDHPATEAHTPGPKELPQVQEGTVTVEVAAQYRATRQDALIQMRRLQAAQRWPT